jgi:hypothetical protein
MDRMKKNRGKTAEAIKSSIKSGGFQKDERIWKYGYVKHPTKKDKKGNALVYSNSVIRFLPISFADYRKSDAGELPDDAVLTPVVCVKSHNFKGPNGDQYRELCRQTLGEECPVNEHDRPLWDKWKEMGKPDNDMKKTLVGRIASDEYYANILVIKDEAVPENEGKVFLFKFGRAINKMIDEAFDPANPTRPSFDPFDPYTGKDLNLWFEGENRKFGSFEGLVPVDIPKESTWIDSQLCGGDDAKIEELLEQAYSLQDFINPNQFKSYEQLKERLKVVLGLSDEEGFKEPDTPVVSQSNSAAPDTSVHENDTPEQKASPTEEVSDDDMDEFARMLAEQSM